MSTSSRSWLFALTALYAISISTSMAAMEIASGLLAFYAFIQGWRQGRRPWTLDDVGLLTIGLVAVILLSLIFGVVRPVIWDRALGLVKNLLVFLLLRWVFSEFTMTDRLRLAWLAFGASGAVGFIALSQHLACQDFFRGREIFGAIVNGESDCRAIGLFSSSMTYGHSVLIPSALLMGVFFLGDRRGRLRTLPALGIWGGLFAAFQRGPWAGLIVASLWIYTQLTRRAKSYLGGLAVGLVGCLLVYSSQFRSRLFSMVSLQAVSNKERFSLWKANWAIFKDHPLLGVGFSHNDKLLPEYFTRLGIQDGFISHAHNNVVDFLSGSGLLGVSLYLALIGVVIYRSRQARLWPKNWRAGFVAMQLALFVAGLTECNFKDGEVTHQFIFWTALALAAGA